jgi:phage terminase large subunit
MVVAAADTRLSTEVRGAVALLWDDETPDEIVIAGSAGTGKTRGVLEYINQRCQQEHLTVLMLRQTLESLKTAALTTFQEQVLYDFDGRQSVADGVTFYGGSMVTPAEFRYAATSSVIRVAGFDRPSKVLSTEYDIIYVNECTELDQRDWQRLVNRLDRPRLVQRAPSKLIGDCNPSTPNHWIKRRAQEGRLALWTSVHEDNPAMWDAVTGQWTPAGLRYLARLDTMTGVEYQRMRLGRWVAAEGLIFPGFTNAMVRQVETTGWRTVVGGDIGSQNPTAILTCHVAGDGRWHISHETYRRDMTSSEIVAAFQAVSLANRPERLWLDPSAKAYIADILMAVGAPNDVLAGIQRVQSLISGGLLTVDPSCVHLIEEFGMYVWDTGGQQERDRPVKDNDHAMDALRYAVMGEATPPKRRGFRTL